MENTDRRSTNVKPVRTSINVDFPAPDSPIIAVSSPALNSPLTFFNSSVFPETGIYIDIFLNVYELLNDIWLKEGAMPTKLSTHIELQRRYHEFHFHCHNTIFPM